MHRFPAPGQAWRQQWLSTLNLNEEDINAIQSEGVQGITRATTWEKHVKLNKILMTSTIPLCGFQYLDTDSPPHTLVPFTVEVTHHPRPLYYRYWVPSNCTSSWVGKSTQRSCIAAIWASSTFSGSQSCCCSRLIVSDERPFSPDAVVYDPDNDDSLGLAEVKCPYSVRFITPAEACSHKDFRSILETSTSTGQHQLKLKRNHKYYSQVQGQMAISKCKWSDFIFTTKGLSVERIPFDSDFFEQGTVTQTDRLLWQLFGSRGCLTCPRTWYTCQRST